jgi:YD repeat-containing protein
LPPVSLLTSIDGPLPGPSDTVRYGYDASGNLTSVTNELGHVTRITRLDAGGRPLSITDPNGVMIELNFFNITEENAPKWEGEDYSKMERVSAISS